MDAGLPCPPLPLQHQVRDNALAVKLSEGLVLRGTVVEDGAGPNLLGQLPMTNYFQGSGISASIFCFSYFPVLSGTGAMVPPFPEPGLGA